MCSIKKIIKHYEKEIPGLVTEIRSFEDPETLEIDKLLYITDFSEDLDRKEVYRRLDSAPDDILFDVLKEHPGFATIIEKRVSYLWSE